ncbi:NYN domain-containing protein [Chloroflexota bacterium]
MPYLIDGHNLIPNVELSLGDLDVEDKLIEILQDFCRIRKTSVEIFFDGGLPGQPTRRKYGSVHAYYVRKGKTADSAIENRLEKLGRTSKNWVVISSDQRVRAAAREVHARSLSSEDFSRLMRESTLKRADDNDNENIVSPEDVSMWLKEFGQE